MFWTLVIPRAAEEPLRKWPREDSSARFLDWLRGAKGKERRVRRGMKMMMRKGSRESKSKVEKHRSV